jgi:hypothetical protein
MGLSIKIAAGPRERIHSQVRVPQDSWPNFNVSDSRLHCIRFFCVLSYSEPRPTASLPVCLGIKHPSGDYDQISITVWQLWVCWCGAFSLTRGRDCRLQLLLALANAVILGSEFLGTHDHILLSQIRDFPFCSLLRLAGLRWRYSTPPPHGSVLFCLLSKSKLPCDWRFTVNQFILASGSLRLMAKDFFSNWNLAGNRPYVISSVTRRWVCLLWMCTLCLLFVKSLPEVGSCRTIWRSLPSTVELSRS